MLVWRVASGLVSGLDDDMSLGPAIDATRGLAMSPTDFAASALPAVKVRGEGHTRTSFSKLKYSPLSRPILQLVAVIRG